MSKYVFKGFSFQSSVDGQKGVEGGSHNVMFLHMRKKNGYTQIKLHVINNHPRHLPDAQGIYIFYMAEQLVM